jgi:threonine synthase
VAIDESRLDGVAARAASTSGAIFGPEGALALVALEQLHARGEIREGERVVVFQTGHPANYAD